MEKIIRVTQRMPIRRDMEISLDTPFMLTYNDIERMVEDLREEVKSFRTSLMDTSKVITTFSIILPKHQGDYSSLDLFTPAIENSSKKGTVLEMITKESMRGDYLMPVERTIHFRFDDAILISDEVYLNILL